MSDHVPPDQDDVLGLAPRLTSEDFPQGTFREVTIEKEGEWRVSIMDYSADEALRMAQALLYGE